MNKVIGYRKMIGTQEMMAKELGISVNTYANKERGNSEFTRKEMMKFHQIIKDRIGDITTVEGIFFY